MVSTTAAGATGSRPALPPLWLLLGVPAAILSTVAFGAIDMDLGVFWVVGMALGFILQRSRFCFAGAFRDLFLSRDGRLMRATLAGLILATGGFWLLMVRLVPYPSFGSLPTMAHITPVGIHLVVGGLLFGIGMVVAGGCVSGTLFRVGEGYIASMVALVGIVAGLSLAAHTWNWWWENFIDGMPLLWLPGIVGHGWALGITLTVLIALYLFVLWLETRDGPTMASFPAKPAPPAITFNEKVATFEKTVLHKGWPVLFGGLALAILNVFSFVYQHPLGVTGELSAWAERIARTFGVGAGPLLGLDLFAGCNLSLGDAGILTSSFTLDAGLIAGAFLAAIASREFKVRFPRRKSRYLQSIGGGVMMGYGAGLAIGCTIGAFFSAIPSLAVSGWIFGISLAGGAFLGTLVLKRLP